jgi:hypothetical protein
MKFLSTSLSINLCCQIRIIILRLSLLSRLNWISAIRLNFYMKLLTWGWTVIWHNFTWRNSFLFKRLSSLSFNRIHYILLFFMVIYREYYNFIFIFSVFLLVKRSLSLSRTVNIWVFNEKGFSKHHRSLSSVRFIIILLLLLLVFKHLLNILEFQLSKILWCGKFSWLILSKLMPLWINWVRNKWLFLIDIFIDKKF